MSLKIINKKVVSYCEIPQDLTEGHWISENSCGSYIDFTLEMKGRCLISDWIRDKYPELEDEEFMIELDY